MTTPAKMWIHYICNPLKQSWSFSVVDKFLFHTHHNQSGRLFSSVHIQLSKIKQREGQSIANTKSNAKMGKRFISVHIRILTIEFGTQRAYPFKNFSLCGLCILKFFHYTSSKAVCMQFIQATINSILSTEERSEFLTKSNARSKILG